MMAGLKRCLGVDIGSDSVKVVELVQAKDKRGLIVQKMCEAPVAIPPGTPAATRNAAIAKALRELLKQHKIQTKKAVFSVPGQAVFVRRIRLPKTTEERLERIIRFEARQQIPFPPDQTILQWEIFEVPGGEELDVLLGAIRKDVINDFMNLVSRCGLDPIQVSVSFFALYNYHVFAHRGIPQPEAKAKKKGKEKSKKKAKAKPKKKPKKKSGKGLKFSLGKKKKGAEPDQQLEEQLEEEPEEILEEELEEPLEDELPLPDEFEEVKAYINLGAATFDLAIHRQSQQDLLGFQRSVPFAGNELTRAIQKKLGLNSSSEAEKIKREKTHAIIPDSGEEQDEAFDAEASEALSQPLERMVSEIRRSLDFYISQPDGMTIDSVTLSGGQAALPHLPEFLEERLGVPVELADKPPESEHLRFPEEAPENYSSFLAALGLALSGMGHSPIMISFLPRTQQVQLEFKKKYIQVAIMLLLIGGMLIASFDIQSGFTTQLAVDGEALERAVQKDADLNTQINQRHTKRVEAVDKFKKLGETAPSNLEHWFRLYNIILSAKPPRIVFTKLEFGSEGELTIQGLTEVDNAAAVFVSNLNNVSGEYLTCADFIVKAEIDDLRPSGLPHPVLNKAVYYFTIKAEMKKKISRLVQPVIVDDTTALPIRGEGMGGLTPDQQRVYLRTGRLPPGMKIPPGGLPIRGGGGGG